ncbi:MAG: class I adenylate cyclase, partial [Pseudomonadota bacterium]
DLQAPLLCDLVKKAVLEAGPEDLPLDPYLITIRRALSFSAEALEPKIQELVRVSAWFKLHSPLNPARPRDSDPKASILEGLAREWGWGRKRVEDMYGYQAWPDKKKLALGEEIQAALFELYSRVASRLRTRYPEEVKVLNGNLAGLNARILARYAKHETKVEDLPSSWHRRDLPGDLNLFHQRGLWQVCDSLKPEDIIYSTSRAARVAAWLNHNRLWRPSLHLRLRLGDTSLKLRTLSGLLKVLAETLPPREIHGLQGGSLLSEPAGPKVLVVNLEEPLSESRMVTAEVIYQTDIGETCHEVLDWPPGTEGEKYLFLVEYFRGAGSGGIDDLVIYVPSGRAEEVISANLKTAWRLFQKGKKEEAGPSATSNLLLDKEDETTPFPGPTSPEPDLKARLDKD